MYVKIELSRPCRKRCYRCREHGQCFPISDDQAVQKRFCIDCISKLLRSCQPRGGCIVRSETALPVPEASPRHSFSPLTFTGDVNHVHP
jgi:hypothetical protein